MNGEALRSNLHCHSTFSDGESTLDELVQAAVAKGFASLGFSEHAYASYDTDCCIRAEQVSDYYAEAARLKEKYAGQIELYTGLEIDSHHPASKDGLDFTIGSVHYIHDGADHYYSVDHTPAILEAARDRVCGGDMRRLVDRYFAMVVELADRYRPDVIGHIDLVRKLNAGGRYFDEDSAWYRNRIGDTAQTVARTGCIVEVNTGAIARGYREAPYPSAGFLHLLRELEVPVMLASDAHTADALDFWFPQARQLLLEVGYRSVKQLRGGKFVDVKL